MRFIFAIIFLNLIFSISHKKIDKWTDINWNGDIIANEQYLDELENAYGKLLKKNIIDRNKLSKIEESLVNYHSYIADNILNYNYTSIEHKSLHAKKRIDYVIKTYNTLINNYVYAYNHERTIKKLEDIKSDKESLDSIIYYFKNINSKNIESVNSLKTHLNLMDEYYYKSISYEHYLEEINNLRYFIRLNNILEDYKTFEIYPQLEKQFITIVSELKSVDEGIQSDLQNKLSDSFLITYNHTKNHYFEEYAVYLKKDNNITELLLAISENENIENNDKISNFLTQYYDSKVITSNDEIDIYELFLANKYAEQNFDIHSYIEEYINSSYYCLDLNIDDSQLKFFVDNYSMGETDKPEYSLQCKEDDFFKNIQIKIDNIDINIDINPKKRINKISSKYIFGYRTIPNPKYSTAQDDVIVAENLYTRMLHQPLKDTGSEDVFANIGNSLYNIGIAENINEALKYLQEKRSILYNTPTIIEVADYKDYFFEEIEYAIDGVLILDITIQYNEISHSLKLHSEYKKQDKFSIGVHMDDSNGYNESLILIPNELMIKNLLYKNISYDIVNQLSPSKLNSIFITEGFNNRFTFKNCLYNYNNNEFCELLQNIFTEKYPKQKNKDLVRENLRSNYKSPFTNQNMTLKETITYAKNSSFQILAYDDNFNAGTGTGYFISNNGFCITNYHVIENFNNVLLMNKINNELITKNAKLIAYDKERDLALLKTDNIFNNSTFININENVKIELGDEIVYIGYPATPITSNVEAEPYVSRGIISQITSNNAGLPSLILFDITANKGASGSALVNQDTGDLIATVTWGAGRTINIKDILSTLRGYNIDIKENQNYGFSVFEIISFLKDNKYY